MSKITIELEPEQIDVIVVEDLKWHLDRFRQDLKLDKPRIFHVDPVKDKKKIKKMILAMRKVLSYYGEKDA
jgi:hypothetical protein